MSSQLVNMNLGFGNKAIGDAIKAQVDKFCFVSPGYGASPARCWRRRSSRFCRTTWAGLLHQRRRGRQRKRGQDRPHVHRPHKVFSRYRSYTRLLLRRGQPTGEPRRFALEPGVPAS
jgi:taurine--2-oxoglutarate transaminase